MNIESDWDKLIIKNFLSAYEVASFFNISRPTIYKLIEKRCIPFYKIGGNIRIKKKDIINYLEKSHFEAITK